MKMTYRGQYNATGSYQPGDIISVTADTLFDVKGWSAWICEPLTVPTNEKE